MTYEFYTISGISVYIVTKKGFNDKFTYCINIIVFANYTICFSRKLVNKLLSIAPTKRGFSVFP